MHVNGSTAKMYCYSIPLFFKLKLYVNYWSTVTRFYDQIITEIRFESTAIQKIQSTEGE